ncbi:MAG: class 1 fructose-bisphosphatase [Chitinophagales bacterium]|nr:class 1 fructose-bisphosphatase [Chitinophagales bacterium]
MNRYNGITLDEFIILKEKDYPDATGNLSKLLRDIGVASKVINREVNKAGLVDILGAAGAVNVQDEEQQKLDVYANNMLINYLKNGGQCTGIGSEENEDIIAVDTEDGKNAHYVVLMDPLDGSSNIDINASIGTIFSIYKRKSNKGLCNLDDFLQEGNKLVAAGYVIYGSSTMLVYSTGSGVNGFTLDPSIGEYCLSHPDIRTPDTGKYYSVNQANYSSFPTHTRRYIDWLVNEKKKGLRYIGSMVGDMHRTLLKGGIFMYPATNSAPEGKLRLLYECIPMAYLMVQAGGRATDSKREILDIIPSQLHERCPIYIGSTRLLKRVDEFVENFGD